MSTSERGTERIYEAETPRSSDVANRECYVPQDLISPQLRACRLGASPECPLVVPRVPVWLSLS